MFNFDDLIIIFSLNMARGLERFSDAFHKQIKPICTQLDCLYKILEKLSATASGNPTAEGGL
tara:strand:+ start:23257 stop:23442 length:186 start_codon:yes stop_codon:yes gene_type:complete